MSSEISYCCKFRKTGDTELNFSTQKVNEATYFESAEILSALTEHQGRESGPYNRAGDYGSDKPNSLHNHVT